MTITAGNVLTNARYILQDTGSDRYTDANLLAWLNEGQKDIIVANPSSLATRIIHTLIGGHDQAIENTYFALLNIPYNLQTASAGDYGAAVTKVSESTLRMENPNWAAESNEDSTVIHWMHEPVDLKDKSFRVYPPQPDGTTQSVEAVVCPYPTAASATTDELDFNDEYQQPLTDYVLYRAYSQEEPQEGGMSSQLAAKHYQLYTEQIKELS